MAIAISNDEQLNNYLTSQLKIALNNTMKVALDKLQEYIQSDVYDSYDPLWYTRTMELLNNWDFTNAQLQNGLISSILSFTKASISWSGEPLWQHGMSKVSNDALVEIVNDGKIGNIANFPQLGERPFFNDFENWVNAHFEEEFIKQCALLGISGSVSYALHR